MALRGGFGSADGSTNWMLRGFGPLWLSAAHIRFIAQNWGAVLKCEHTPRVRFCFSHLLKLNFKVHKSALFVSFRAKRHDGTPVLLLAGDRQRFAMPRNLAHCVHIILNIFCFKHCIMALKWACFSRATLCVGKSGRISCEIRALVPLCCHKPDNLTYWSRTTYNGPLPHSLLHTFCFKFNWSLLASWSFQSFKIKTRSLHAPLLKRP